MVSAASYSSSALAAGSIATAFGTGLEGTSVDVIDSTGFARAGQLFYVSPTQVNFLIPAGTAGGNASIVIASSDGTASFGGATIRSVAPGLFTADASGTGVTAGVARVFHADGTVTSTLTFTCVAAGNCTAIPIVIGDATDRAVVELYGTGIRGSPSLDTVHCTVGGIAAPVLYAGPQGQYTGEDQVNISLPTALAGAGVVSINLTVDGYPVNTVTLLIR